MAGGHTCDRASRCFWGRLVPRRPPSLRPNLSRVRFKSQLLLIGTIGKLGFKCSAVHYLYIRDSVCCCINNAWRQRDTLATRFFFHGRVKLFRRLPSQRPGHCSFLSTKVLQCLSSFQTRNLAAETLDDVALLPFGFWRLLSKLLGP